MDRIEKSDTGITKKGKLCISCNLWKIPLRFPESGDVCKGCKKDDDTHIIPKTRALELI